jgi:SAM-dependent methyltransferase
LADGFDTDVFDPTGTDLGGAFERALRRVGRVELAVDLGCGTGRLLPRLLRQANRVVGIDFAEELLHLGRARLGENERAELRRVDLARPLRSPRGAELATCSNVLLAPDEALRLAILRNCRRVLAPGGRLLLIVPSLESALWVNDRLVAWNRRAGIGGTRAFRGGIGTDPSSARDLLGGIVDQGGVRTKHYLREELEETLRRIGFEIDATERIEYAWGDYFDAPPKWLGATGPWDWLVQARRDD